MTETTASLPATFDPARLKSILTELFRQQAEAAGAEIYMRLHGGPKAIDSHVRTFLWYREFLPPSGRVLDWGCNYAPDSCLFRAAFGDRFDLHSCDFSAVANHPVFHDYAATEYTPLTHSVELPYEDESFEVVVGSGVLEHTAMDYESLKELHRILKPSGILVVTYLPNRWSLKEWIQRVIRKRGYHNRLYGLGETQRLLKHSGFLPLAAGYHTFFWQRKLESVGLGRVRWLPRLLSKVVPIDLFSSTLFFVARRVGDM